MKELRLVVLALLGILVLAGVGCSGGGSSGSPTATASPQADVKVMDHALECETSSDLRVEGEDLECVTSKWSDYCNCDLTGVLENLGADAVGVMVHADFTDDQGVKLAEGSSYVGELESGQTAQFNVPYYELECPEDFEITVTEWGKEYECHLTGTVMNTGGADASGVTVEARFLDAEGGLLAEDTEYIGNVQSGHVAHYDIPYRGEQRPEDYSVWVEWNEE